MTANILSINGGGIRGLIALRQIVELEKMLKRPLYQHFDFITGTSTGGIIATLLSIGYTAEELMNVYVNHGRFIFEKRFLHFGLIRPKYSDKYFNHIIESYTDGKTLYDCKTNIVIPAFNATKNELVLFKSNKIHDTKDKKNYSLFDVIRSTSSAPGYFKPHKIDNDYFIDGGLVVNNPVQMAIIEAMKEGFDKFQVISFTTGNVVKPIEKSLVRSGMIRWANPSISILLREMDKTTNYLTKVQFDIANELYGKRIGTYIRCESYIKKSSGKIDDASKENIRKMVEDGMNSAEINKNKMRVFFFNTLKHER